MFFDLHFLHEYLEWDVKTECSEMKNHILHLTALGFGVSLQIFMEKIQSPFLQYFHKYYDTMKLKTLYSYLVTLERDIDSFELRI